MITCSSSKHIPFSVTFSSTPFNCSIFARFTITRLFEFWVIKFVLSGKSLFKKAMAGVISNSTPNLPLYAICRLEPSTYSIHSSTPILFVKSSMFCCTFYIIEWGKVTNLSHKNKNLQTTIPIEIASLPYDDFKKDVIMFLMAFTYFVYV